MDTEPLSRSLITGEDQKLKNTINIQNKAYSLSVLCNCKPSLGILLSGENFGLCDTTVTSHNSERCFSWTGTTWREPYSVSSTLKRGSRIPATTAIIPLLAFLRQTSLEKGCNLSSLPFSQKGRPGRGFYGSHLSLGITVVQVPAQEMELWSQQQWRLLWRNQKLFPVEDVRQGQSGCAPVCKERMSGQQTANRLIS